MFCFVLFFSKRTKKEKYQQQNAILGAASCLLSLQNQQHESLEQHVYYITNNISIYNCIHILVMLKMHQGQPKQRPPTKILIIDRFSTFDQASCSKLLARIYTAFDLNIVVAVLLIGGVLAEYRPDLHDRSRRLQIFLLQCIAQQLLHLRRKCVVQDLQVTQKRCSIIRRRSNYRGNWKRVKLFFTQMRIISLQPR